MAISQAQENMAVPWPRQHWCSPMEHCNQWDWSTLNQWECECIQNLQSSRADIHTSTLMELWTLNVLLTEHRVVCLFCTLLCSCHAQAQVLFRSPGQLIVIPSYLYHNSWHNSTLNLTSVQHDLSAPSCVVSSSMILAVEVSVKLIYHLYMTTSHNQRQFISTTTCNCMPKQSNARHDIHTGMTWCWDAVYIFHLFVSTNITI